MHLPFFLLIIRSTLTRNHGYGEHIISMNREVCFNRSLLCISYLIHQYISACALQFIMDYVSTSEKIGVPRDQIFMMRMKKPRFLLLAQLFDHYMSYGHVVKIAQHRALRDPQFLTFFINYIKKKEPMHDIILRVDSLEKASFMLIWRKIKLMVNCSLFLSDIPRFYKMLWNLNFLLFSTGFYNMHIKQILWIWYNMLCFYFHYFSHHEFKSSPV